MADPDAWRDEARILLADAGAPGWVYPTVRDLKQARELARRVEIVRSRFRSSAEREIAVELAINGATDADLFPCQSHRDLVRLDGWIKTGRRGRHPVSATTDTTFSGDIDPGADERKTAPQESRSSSAPAEPVRPALVRMADVEPLRVSWLWQHRIPLGMLSLLEGDPGLGKSTTMIDLAARVTTGAAMPFESGRREPSAVILCSAEDHLAATMRPRLDAHGADSRRVFAVTAMPVEGDADKPMVLTAEDIARLELVVAEHKATLVVVDPLMAYLDGDTDAHKDQDIRRSLRSLSTMAERTGAAVVVVRHLRKSSGPALYRGGGSIGVIGAARAAMFVAKDPEDPDLRLLAMSKSNLSKLAATVRWRLVDQHGVGRVEWLGVADGITADDLAAVSENIRDDSEPDPIDRVMATLRELLADGGKPTKEVEADLKAMTGASLRTIERAREQMGKELVPYKFGKTWALRLANSAAPRGSGGHGGVDRKADSTAQRDTGMKSASDAETVADMRGGVEDES